MESLQSRREAAAISSTLKLLDGKGRGVLNDMMPEIYDASTLKKRSRHSCTGIQLVSRSKVYSLDSFKRSYLGSIHSIWAKLPQSLIQLGNNGGWRRITKRCKRFLVDPVLYEEKVMKHKLLVEKKETRFETSVE